MYLPLIINSSDNTIDVFKAVYQENRKRLVDFNERCYYLASNEVIDYCGIKKINVTESSWSTELKDALEQINDEHVIIMLDDFFLLSPLDARKINSILHNAHNEIGSNFDYIRLKPVERQALVYAFNLVRAYLGGKKFLKLDQTEPYFSSLQLAVWRRKYLLSLLKKEVSIWDFENIVSDGDCFAVTQHVCFYKHMVEKGKWFWFAKFFLDVRCSDRESHTILHSLHHVLIRIRFNLFGYTFVRLLRK